MEEVTAKSPDLSAPVHQLSLGSGSFYSSGAYFEQGLQRGSELFAPILPIAGVASRNLPLLPHLQQAIPLPVMALGTGSLGSSEQANEATVSYGGDVTVLSRSVAIPTEGNISVSRETSIGRAPLGLGAQIGFPYPIWGLAPGFCKPSSSLTSDSKVVKPTACPAKMDEGSEMAKLTLGPSPSSESSNLTLKLLEQHPSRTSAFQLKAPFSSNNLGPSTISVV